jgi:glycosyltransferase involved in cell wall biosynthesis
VIAYSSAGLVDSVKNKISGILCEKSPGVLSETILKVFRDKILMGKLQEGARKWSKNFSWEKSVKLSIKLLDKVAD